MDSLCSSWSMLSYFAREHIILRVSECVAEENEFWAKRISEEETNQTVPRWAHVSRGIAGWPEAGGTSFYYNSNCKINDLESLACRSWVGPVSISYNSNWQTNDLQPLAGRSWVGRVSVISLIVKLIILSPLLAGGGWDQFLLQFHL